MKRIRLFFESKQDTKRVLTIERKKVNNVRKKITLDPTFVSVLSLSAFQTGFVLLRNSLINVGRFELLNKLHYKSDAEEKVKERMNELLQLSSSSSGSNSSSLRIRSSLRIAFLARALLLSLWTGVTSSESSESSPREL